MITKNIVLGFPYEGGLLGLLNQEDSRTASLAKDHPYYRVLFGPQSERMRAKATALISLFEEVILVSSNSALPDYSTFTTGDTYFHPDLRLRVPRAYNEWEPANKDLATAVMQDMSVKTVLQADSGFPVDEHERIHLLCRLLIQMRLAQEHSAVIVGDERLGALHSAVLAALTQMAAHETGTLRNSRVLPLDCQTLSIVGLDFGCDKIDTFAAVRQSKEIRTYATQFRDAIFTAQNSPNLRQRLLSLMREAREKSEIAKQIAGGFETSSSVTSVVGLLPFVGTVIGMVGLSTDAAARAARHTQTAREWYLIGPKMRQVALEHVLSQPDNEKETMGDNP